MKAKGFFLTGVLLMLTTSVIADNINGANQTLLPEQFVIYTDGKTVINHPEIGFAEKQLPTVNLYKGNPGCYIACYSQKKDNAIYAINDNTFALGQVRIAGRYSKGVCEPTNFSGKNITQETAFRTICTDKIPACVGVNCWAGGETGSWFGL